MASKARSFILSATKLAQCREVGGILLLLFAAFSFVALWTFHPADYGGLRFPAETSIRNGAGRFGAMLAYRLFMDLGLASYLLVTLAGFWGTTIFLDRPVRQFALKAFGVAVFIATSATLLALLRPGAPEPVWEAVRGGGLLGAWMARALTLYCGTIGAFLALLFTASVSLVLATDWMIYTALCRVGHYAAIGGRCSGATAVRYGGALWGQFQAWRKTHAEMREEADRRRRSGELEIQRRAREEKRSSRDLAAVAAPAKPTSARPAPEQAPLVFQDTAIAEPPPQTAPPVLERPAPRAPVAPPPAPVRPPAPARPTAPRPAPSADHATPKFTPASTHQKETIPFELPKLDLLEEPAPPRTDTDEKDLIDRMALIENTLRHFDIESKVVAYEKGPVVTQYELELAPGIRVHKIVGMADDLAIALKAPSVRIIAPIPGKGTIGIEVPNAYTDIVRLKELLTAPGDAAQKQAVPLYFGKDAAGTPIVKDLSDMPHLLIAGTTGSGKSVCLNTIIMSLLLTRKPEDLRIVMVDPKMVELSAFRDIPHLLAPVVTEMKRAPIVLEWLVRTMEERYALFARVGVKKIDSFNALGPEKILARLSEEGEEPPDVPTHLPYLVIIIDELADLMMVASKEVETLITRLAQKSRAVGIHMVLATQRPSVDVITGLIKSNMPARIAFKVASKIDSRTILDRNGAERLLGRGDMLWLDPSTSNLMRAQCTYVADKEIRDVVKYLREQAEPVFDRDLFEIGTGAAGEVDEKDDLFDTAVRIILETQRGSVSLLQRRLEVGYTRAARLVDMMAKSGIVGDYKGSKAREVLMTLPQWEARHGAGSEAAGAMAEASTGSRPDGSFDPGESGPSQAERMREGAEEAYGTGADEDPPGEA